LVLHSLLLFGFLNTFIVTVDLVLQFEDIETLCFLCVWRFGLILVVVYFRFSSFQIWFTLGTKTFVKRFSFFFSKFGLL